MAVLYAMTALGITLGFHRLLTHRSFATHKWVEYTLAIMGSAAVQGPVMSWVADHRKHHAHTDHEGDPHSPHGHGSGFKGSVKGLWYAHMGWLFDRAGQAEHHRYASELYEDAGMPRIQSTSRLGPDRSRDPVRHRLRHRREPRRRAGRALWAGAVRDLPPAPRDVVDQLGLPLLRHAPLRRRRPLHQRLLAVRARDGRVVAPQPPRLPALGRATACAGGRSTRPPG